MALEDSYAAIAKASNKPSIILCDRGAMDTKAYLDDNMFQALLDYNGWTVTSMRDSRYDCIIHLVTAAIGAESYYTLENNSVRTETPQEAAALDMKMREAYLGHPNVYIVDNSTNFDRRYRRYSTSYKTR